VVNMSIKEEIIKEIEKKGFPIISVFDFADASATIYVDSDRSVYVDDYGSEFVEESSIKAGNLFNEGDLTLMDLTDEGLIKVKRYGIRKSDSDWNDLYENYVVEYGWV